MWSSRPLPIVCCDSNNVRAARVVWKIITQFLSLVYSEGVGRLAADGKSLGEAAESGPDAVADVLTQVRGKRVDRRKNQYFVQFSARKEIGLIAKIDEFEKRRAALVHGAAHAFGVVIL